MAAKDTTLEMVKIERSGQMHAQAVGCTPVDILELLKKSIQENNEESFHQHLAELERLLQDSGTVREWLATSGALNYATDVGTIPMIDTLVQKGLDTNFKSIYYMNFKEYSAYVETTPLHVAAAKDNLDAVKYLVDSGADFKIKQQYGGTPLHNACYSGSTKTVTYLLEKGADPTAVDDDGENSLSWAICSRQRDVAAVLLRDKRWKQMLKSSDREFTTPLRGLICAMPDIAEEVFSRCVTTNEGKKNWCGKEVYADSPDLKVVFNYEFLEDYLDKDSSDMEDPPNQGNGANLWRPKKFTKYNHPLYLIKKYGRSRLQKHPLVTSLLKYKWNKFGRFIFFGNLFLYLIFLAFLTAFSLVILSPVERTCVDIFMATFNGTVPETCNGLTLPDYQFLYAAAVITILTALLQLALEILKWLKHPLDYMLDWVNWLGIPLYLFSILFTVTSVAIANPCLCIYSWQWQIGVVAVFLGWIELIAFLWKWPVTGVYVLMFVNIIESFLKISFLALLLVIAFAFAFYMLLFEPDEMRNAFSNPGRAILKVMAMTTGELDYDELYHQQEGEQEIAFPPVSFIIWIIFLVLMPILLSNLLVGLAVGEVDHLKQTASERRIELQVNLILSLEELLEFLCIRHHFITKKYQQYPNNHWYDPFSNSLPDRYSNRPVNAQRTSGEKISEAIKPPPDSIEKQLHTLSEQVEARLKEQSEQFEQAIEQAIKQLSVSHKEQAEEQNTKADQIAGELASLREKLQELITKECMLEALKKSILENNEESFHQHLAELERLLQDNGTVREWLVTSGALNYAAEVGSIPMIDTLLKKGLDVNTRSVHCIKHFEEYSNEVETTPLHVAATKGNLDAVRYLVDSGADFNIEQQYGGTPLHNACYGGCVKTVMYLLEKGADPTAEDEYGEKPLSWAIHSRHKDIAEVLLEDERWKQMLMSSDTEFTTPLRGLIVIMPDLAEKVFSKCVTTNEGKLNRWGKEVYANSPDFEVVFNYELVDDYLDKHSSDMEDPPDQGNSSLNSWRPKKFTRYNHPLYLIKKYGTSSLLKHPLGNSLHEYKWNKIGRYFFLGNFFLTVLFLSFLTAFSLVVLSPLEKICVEVLSGNESLNGTAPEVCEGLSIPQYQFLYISAAVTILIAVLRLAEEMIRICKHPLEYLLGWANLKKPVLYTSSIIFTFVFATPCLCVYSWQWQTGAVAVFLGWIELTVFLLKWPVTGVYLLMFGNMVLSFFKVAILALLLVITFGLPFYMLLFEPDEMRNAFSSPWRAILKVMSMIIGELDYDELYHQQEGEEEIAFPEVSFLLWVTFLILMPILLSNLLVGLAVGDVDRLQQTAVEKKIELQVDLLLALEEVLEFLHIRHYFVTDNHEIYPNQRWYDGFSNLLSEHCRSGQPHVQRRTGEKISEAIKPAPDSIEKLLHRQSKQLEARLKEQGYQLGARLKEQGEQLEARLKEQGEQLEARLKGQGEQLEEQSKQLEARLREQSEQLEEAVHQLSEYHKELAKEQTLKAEQLAGEVSSLRETLQRLITNAGTTN